MSHATAGLVACIALLPSYALAQVRLDHGPVALTVEAYANVTAASYHDVPQDDRGDDDLRVDAAVRLFAVHESETGPDAGVRFVVEQSTGSAIDLAEASVLLIGKRGRLEVGERQGLPDVLLGFAPNNFTFTGAEFGPASGPSLDPGGGLQTSFLDAALAAELRDLTSLGFAATLADDRSAKVLYVSPKRDGWIAGLSHAPDATDTRYGGLLQAGLTHDRYWGDNALHVGGSYSHGRATADGSRRRDLHSINVGATLVLRNDWMFGASVTYDGRSGLSARAPGEASADAAWGAVTSLNYNRGPWTAGAFAQWSTREGDQARRGDDRFGAFEAGLSYRISTRLRLYGAWYSYAYDADGGALAADRHRGDLLLIGLRATL